MKEDWQHCRLRRPSHTITTAIAALSKAPSTPSTMSKQHYRSDNVECYKSNDSFDKKSKQIERVLFVSTLSKGLNFTKNSFDVVAKNGNNVEAMFDFVEATFNFIERIVRLVTFDNVASTLLLVWTGVVEVNADTTAPIKLTAERDRTERCRSIRIKFHRCRRVRIYYRLGLYFLRLTAAFSVTRFL